MIGTQIGGYRIVEHLASGGMGAVYVARHEILGREAAIKVLLPAFSADQEMVHRFVNEARATAQIHHPGIVDVFDIGTLPSGQTYITMERLHGESLADRLRRGPLTTAQALALTRQFGSALGAAHAIGIAHRDLKPQNLFLAADPSVRDPIAAGGERLKILDFGIAKLGSGHSNTFATAKGALLGTPMYMAPEQWTAAGAVDARSDLYAIGCILFECLCGRPPFVGGIELIAAHVRDLPPSPRSLNPAIPAEVERLLLALLEKDPARRPQSCAELVATLERAVQAPDRPPPAVRLPPDTVRVSEVSNVAVRPRSRLWVLAAAASAALLPVVVVGYIMTRGWDRAAPAALDQPSAKDTGANATAGAHAERRDVAAPARACAEEQVAAIARRDDAAFAAAFAEDGFVFLPETVARGRSEIETRVLGMYLHLQPTSATVREFRATQLTDDVVWTTAEVEMWLDNLGALGPQTLRVTQLVVLDHQGGCEVVASHMSLPVSNRVARSLVSPEPTLLPLPGAETDLVIGQLVRADILASTHALAGMLADDPDAVVIGSAPMEKATGTQARKLLEKWSRNQFFVYGGVLHVEDPRGYAFDAVNIQLPLKNGEGAIEYRMLVLYRSVVGQDAEVVSVHYSNEKTADMFARE